MRDLLIRVDCGEVTCGRCCWRSRTRFGGGDCDMFQEALIDGSVRVKRCLDAERGAKELAAPARAQAQEAPNVRG